MAILDGYAILAYDFRVSHTHPDCIFHMTQSLEEKELDLLKQAQEFLKRNQASSKDFSSSYLSKIDKMVSMF